MFERTQRAAACAFVFVSSAAGAQTFEPQVVPQSDVNCDFFTNPNPAFCPATVNGRRTGAPITPVVVANGRVTGDYRINFAGNLQIDGVPLNGLGDASIYYDPASVRVDLDTTYVGRLNASTAGYNPTILPRYFNSYRSENITVNSIDVNVANGNATDANTGLGYTYRLASVNPNNIVNSSTALSGVYKSDDDDSTAIRFGTLEGTARVLAGGVTTPNPYGAGGAFFSPFAVQLEIVAQETTRLDETGLITPKIAVTQGIDMNGSRVSDLGDGVAPGDAVNRRQLDAETVARADGDAALATQLAGEAATRNAADVELGSRVDTEVQARALGDAALATQIAAEGATRNAADVALGSRVDAEVQARASGDDALAAQIAGEAAARNAGDVVLGGRIDTEAATRSSAVQQVSANLAVERDQRVAADSAMGTALNNEMSARMAADVGLANGLSALRTDVNNLSFKLEEMDRRVSSGTAVAVAMGGGVFLPGKQVNVTMNVATYDGAHAGSLQVGVLVSSNVAINGGVATGFNRSGKTAGRAGVSFGF